MKHLRSILAVLLSFTLCVSLMAPAFAAPSSGNNGNGVTCDDSDSGFHNCTDPIGSVSNNNGNNKETQYGYCDCCGKPVHMDQGLNGGGNDKTNHWHGGWPSGATDPNQPTPEPTATPSATPEPTATPSATPEPTATPSATPEPTAPPSATPEPSTEPSTVPDNNEVEVPENYTPLDDQPNEVEVPDENIPLNDLPEEAAVEEPEVELEDPEIPLAEEPEEEEEIELEDPEIPLADVPSTGDSFSLWYVAAAISALGLVVLLATDEKKEQEI